MTLLQGHSLDWAGDMVASPHGDWFHKRDVERLQDELEAALKALKAAQAPVAAPEVLKHDLRTLPGRIFGYANPDEARRYNGGKAKYCRIIPRLTDVFCMPVLNLLGPNHYQKPPIGTVVHAFGGPQAVVFGHDPQGLIVKFVDGDGSEQLITKWVWKR